MEKNAVAHSQQVNAFFPVIRAVVYIFNREVIVAITVTVY